MMQFTPRNTCYRTVLNQLFTKVHSHIMLSNQWSSSVAGDVLFSENKATGIIKLNRPKALNSLNLIMVQKMYENLKKWESKDSRVKQVLIHGGEGKAFCAGGDVVGIINSIKSKSSLHQEFFCDEYRLNLKTGTYCHPYTAIIDGITMGGGLGVSIHGHYRVATDRSLIAMPETAIGLFADVGTSYPLSRLPHNIGIFMALTGHRLKGRDVYHSGIATHYVKSSLVKDLIEKMSELSHPSHESVSRILNDFHSKSLDKGENEFTLKPDLPKIEKMFCHKKMEDIMASLIKDGSDWSKAHFENLSKMSPTSLKVTLRSMHEARKLNSLEDVLNLDLRLVTRFTECHDFIEGVRAKLIDKDNNPKWNPGSIEGVTNDMVDRFFSPLPPQCEFKQLLKLHN